MAVAMGAFVTMLATLPFDSLRTNVYMLGDLRAFYCSARVAVAGFDPYLAEPIGGCERASVAKLPGNFVIPAPLPGHTIGLLEPLALLPFPVAAGFWCILVSLTYFALSVMLARLTAVPFTAALFALLPLAFLIPVFKGQLVSISIVLLVAATFALRSNRDNFAALLAAVSTIEPHIGLPACVALFIARPRARLTLSVAAFGLAALGVHSVGLAGTIEYVARVLPAHVASEARYDDQYSLTYLLTWLDVPVPAAIALGQCSYWLIAAAAIAAALAVAKRSGDVQWLLFVPMAMSVVGGPYVHEEHLLAGVPLALLLAATASKWKRPIAILALALVAWPAKYLLERFAVPGVVMHLSMQSTPHTVGATPFLAETPWAARIAEHVGHWPMFLTKVPSWLGLIVVVALFAARLRGLQTRFGKPTDTAIPEPPARRALREV